MHKAEAGALIHADQHKTHSVIETPGSDCACYKGRIRGDCKDNIRNQVGIVVCTCGVWCGRLLHMLHNA